MNLIQENNKILTEKLSIDLLSSSSIPNNPSYLNGLILLLKCSFLYPFHSILFFYFRLFLLFLLWLITFLIIFNLFLFSSSQYLYHQIGNCIWIVHSILIYSILSYDIIYNKGKILFFMNSISCDINNENFKINTNISENYCSNLTRISWFSTILVFCGVLANMITIGFLFLTSNGLFIVLSLSHSLWFNLFGMCLWYFYSYGWVLSLPFACIPSYALHYRIELFISYLQQLSNEISTSSYQPSYTVSIISSSSSSSEIMKTMLPFDHILEWYDELYFANKLLISNVSLLLTVDIICCSILSVFLLHVSHPPSPLLLFLCSILIPSPL